MPQEAVLFIFVSGVARSGHSRIGQVDKSIRLRACVLAVALVAPCVSGLLPGCSGDQSLGGGLPVVYTATASDAADTSAPSDGGDAGQAVVLDEIQALAIEA